MPDCITSALVLSIPPEARLAADTETAPATVSAAQRTNLPSYDILSNTPVLTFSQVLFCLFRLFCFEFFDFLFFARKAKRISGTLPRSLKHPRKSPEPVSVRGVGVI